MKKTVEDIDLKGKKVIMRADFNVPLNDAGEITDDTRIEAALPTIKYILGQNAALILMSHLGRPANEPDPKYSLAPVAKALSEKLGLQVIFNDDGEVVGEVTKKAATDLKPGQVLLLQNTRFRPEEKKVGFFEFNLPRLGDQNLTMELYGREGLAERTGHTATFDLYADLLNQGGLTWTEKNLPDVDIIIDYQEHTVNINVCAWSHDDISYEY